MRPNAIIPEYASQKEKLKVPEYGRSIQNMIKVAKNIEDPVKRQNTIEAIIQLMQQLNPTQNIADNTNEKLWHHVFRVCDFELEVTPPEGIPIPTPENTIKHKQKVSYPIHEYRFRHYGHNVQTLIRKALAMEEGPKRDAFVHVIASFMKLAYRTWNKEHFVSDEVIIEDLNTLCEGKLTYSEETFQDGIQLKAPSFAPPRRNNPRFHPASRGGRHPGNGRGGGNFGRDKNRRGGGRKGY